MGAKQSQTLVAPVLDLGRSLRSVLTLGRLLRDQPMAVVAPLSCKFDCVRKRGDCVSERERTRRQSTNDDSEKPARRCERRFRHTTQG